MWAMPVSRALLATSGYAALAILDSALAGSARRRSTRRITKPLLMPALLVATRSATPPAARGTALARGTFAAQVFSWGGDIALLGRGERAFLTGLGSFLAAHVGYIAAFASARDRTGTPLGRPLVRAAAAIWVTATPVMAVAAHRRSPALAGPVAGYGTALAAMVAASGALDPEQDATGRRAVAAGTGLFLVSDSLLGAQRFLLAESRPSLERAVMVTYAAGQGLIALGVARLARPR